MEVKIMALYSVPGVKFDFSYQFVLWLTQALKERIQPSKSFNQAYSEDYSLVLNLGAKPNISEPEIHGPKIYKRDKEIEFKIILPHGGQPLTELNAYERPVRLLLESTVTILRKLGIENSKILEDIPVLLKHFASSRGMIHFNA